MGFWQRAFLVSLLLVAFADHATAGKDKDDKDDRDETSFPTVAPAPTLTPSNFPTVLASSSPTKGLTSKPSAVQSELPVASPTTSPSLLPSSTPTDYPGPTAFPTGTPSQLPTISRMPTRAPVDAPSASPTNSPAPSDMPSDVPSSTPTSSKPPSILPSLAPTIISAVTLPEMVVTIRLQESQVRRKLLDDDELQEALKAFFTTVLSKNNNLESVDLQTSSTLDESTGECDVTLTGTARYYERGSAEEKTTSEDLADALSAYFGVWGTDELKQALSDAGFAVESVNVKINGKSVSAIEEPAPVPHSTGDDSISSGALAGAVVGGVFAVVLIGFVFGRRRKSRDREVDYDDIVTLDSSPPPPPATTKDTTPASSNTGLLGATPRRSKGTDQAEVEAEPKPESERGPDSEAEQERLEKASVLTDEGAAALNDDGASYSTGASYSGIVSVQDSVFTTDADHTFTQPPSSTYQYDASRLDQVISSAKGYSKELDGDNKA